MSRSTGVPVFLGFFAKWQVIAAVLSAGFVWLAVLGVITSVIGAFYYLRIVYLMYFGEARDGLDGIRGGRLGDCRPDGGLHRSTSTVLAKR